MSRGSNLQIIHLVNVQHSSAWCENNSETRTKTLRKSACCPEWPACERRLRKMCCHLGEGGNSRTWPSIKKENVACERVNVDPYVYRGMEHWGTIDYLS